MSRKAIRHSLLCFLLAGSLMGAGPSAQTPRPGSGFSPTYRTALRLLGQNMPAEALAEIDRGLKDNPRDASLYNLQGLALGSLGHLDEAESSFRTVIRLEPQAAIGYGNLAVLFEETGRSAEAVALFREALKREPGNSAFQMRLGANLASMGQFREAAVYLAKAWAARPGDFRTGYEYARALRELKRPAEAEEVFRRLNPPSDPQQAARYHALSALLAEDRGDRMGALRSYRRAYELDPSLFAAYVRIIQLMPAADAEDFSALPPAPPHLTSQQHFALGLAFASRGVWLLAESYFEDVLQQDPENDEACYDLALADREAGHKDLAIELLRKRIERKPSAELINLLASFEEETGNFVEAARNFQRAVEMDPHNEQYVFDLGAEYMAHANFDLAREVFRAGTARFPKSSREYVGLGIAQFALRKYTEAANAFLTALELDPSSPRAASAWYSLAPSLSPTEWEPYIPQLKGLAETHPAIAEAQFCYGATLLRVGIALGKREWIDVSEGALAAAIRLKPGFTDAHLELGSLFAARKQDEKAQEEFLKAVRLDPNSIMGHYRLGQTYRNLGRLQLAQAELARYQELARRRNDRVTQSRQAVKQFVILGSESKYAPRAGSGKE